MSKAVTYLNSALRAHASGNLEEAKYFYKKTLAEDSQNSTALGWLGVIEAQHKNYDVAEDLLIKALSKEKNNQDFLINYANLLFEKNQFHDAVTYYQKSSRQRPNDPICFANLAVCYAQQSQPLLGLRAADQSIQLKPDYAEAWFARGIALQDLKQYEEALASYEQAIKLTPYFAEAWSNRGLTLQALKRYDEAISHYEQAIQLKPDYAEAWSNKGFTLYKLKRYEEAIAHYDKALSFRPNIDWLLGDLLHAKMKICNWSGLIESLDVISKKLVAEEWIATPFVLLSLIDNNWQHKKCSEIYIQSRYPFNPVLKPILKRPQSHKIRVGYFSADFKNHPVAILTAELFELHDRSQFEIYGFSFGVDDKSPMRLRLSQTFNQFIDVSDMSDLEIAELSRNLQIDIAVDLGGHTQNSRTGIFSYRAAPIQISYIGYIGTMGAEYYDYLLADKTTIPDELQNFYTEKIAYLPSYQVNDRKRTISERQFTREELGLPETGFVFCCLNDNYKILPSAFDGWLRILNAVEGSVLFLLADNEWAKANLIDEASLRGLDTTRLIFGGRISAEEYRSRYLVCDLFLDTFPYNAGTTASDALWVGLPVLTLMGQSFVSRMAASLLNAIGLPELITNTQKEYEALAIELATNPQKLAEIKLKLANNRLTTPLFDTPRFTKNLESAYLKMHERYLEGLPPECIYV
jgi:predicted O-linked N-acetylglucosamine transferase (SPINDLY family)